MTLFGLYGVENELIKTFVMQWDVNINKDDDEDDVVVILSSSELVWACTATSESHKETRTM